MNFRSELLSAQNEVKYQNETMRKALTAALRAQVLPETMSFSAGIPPLDVVSQHREEVLTDEVQQQKDEVGIYKAWIRQMDEMYNEELKASSQSRGGSQEKEQKKIGDNNPNDKDFYYPKKPCPLDHRDPQMIPEVEEVEEMLDHLTLLVCLHYEDHRETHRMMS